MQTILLIMPVLVSVVLTALMVPCIIRLSYKKQLFDTIDERTVHSGIVPRLGGGAFLLSVAVSVGVALAMPNLIPDGVITTVGNSSRCNWLAPIGSALIMYFVGVIDDIKTINYKYKFLSQFVSAAMLVFLGNFWIKDLCGLLGVGELTEWVGKPLSLVFIMFVINAFNLIDGIDGLASSLGVIGTTLLGVLFVVVNHPLAAVLSFALSASLLVFFCYNKFGTIKTHTKIFMGDGGSQTMGLLLAFLIIDATISAPAADSVRHVPYFVLSITVAVLPALDALRVMSNRMLKRNNPFLPDKTHIHHKFLQAGFNPTKTLLAILTAHILLLSINTVVLFCFDNLPQLVRINAILVLDILVWCVINQWLNVAITKCQASQE